MRFFIRFILALGFLLAGVILFFAAVRLISERRLEHDTNAAIPMAGMAILIIAISLWAVVRSKKSVPRLMGADFRCYHYPFVDLERGLWR